MWEQFAKKVNSLSHDRGRIVYRRRIEAPVLPLVLAGLLMLIANTALLADTLVLRNGKTYNDIKIVQQSRVSIRFRDREGRMRSVAKSQVRRLVYGPAKPKKEIPEKISKAAEKIKTEKQAAAKPEQASKKPAPAVRPAATSLSAADRRYRDSVWRSALLPGWGQYYRRNETKGTVLGAAALGLAAYTLQQRTLAIEARRRFADPLPALGFYQVGGGAGFALNALYFENETAKIKAVDQRTVLGASALVLLWGFNLTDILFWNESPGSAAATSLRPALVLRVDPFAVVAKGRERPSAYLGARWRF